MAASYERFNYLLRPAKQVERKLFVEAMHCLSNGGFSIPEYTYVGFGSVYYADFVIFHKYLYIKKMICAEQTAIPRRMKFNKPFDFVDLRMGAIAEVIPTLSREERSIVWLDYDYPLDREVLRDIAGCVHVLAPGSILIVTVEADSEAFIESHEGSTEAARQDLTTDFGSLRGRPIERSDISQRGLPLLMARILRAHLHAETSRRAGIGFRPLFNFRYADGRQMLSFGGVIADSAHHRLIEQSGITKLPFVVTAPEPLRIAVPPLTVREKLWLDANIGSLTDPTKVDFEIGKEELESYVAFYKHYPVYYETLV